MFAIQEFSGSGTEAKVISSSWWPVDTQLVAYQQATRTLIESYGTICCLYTTMSS